MINDKLRTLIVLDKEKSYTRTAQICNLTQPAVTQHIQSLEEQYNISIFKRVGKNLITTPEGKILIKNAKRLIAMNKNLERELYTSLTKQKKLDIGITLTASDYFIPEILNVFKIKYPSMHFNFHTDNIENIIERIRYLELDFAIVEGNFDYKNLEVHLLAKDQLILIASPKHPLTKYDEVTWDMLKDEKLILRHQKANTREILENYLEGIFENLNNFTVILEIENTSLIRHLVIDGHGISFMAKSACRNLLNLGVLKEIKIKDFNLERGVYLIHQKKYENDEIIKDILKLKDLEYSGL